MTDSSSNRMISDFSGKPRTLGYYASIDAFVMGHEDVARSAKAQVSYSVNRKFLWLWAYEQTADGTLYLNVTLDHVVTEDRVHRVTQVSTNRWNHHVEVKSARTATSAWLRRLITAGLEFARQ
jgi:hypothetical protein